MGENFSGGELLVQNPSDIGLLGSAATRCVLGSLNASKCVCGPRTSLEGAYSAPYRAVFKREGLIGSNEHLDAKWGRMSYWFHRSNCTKRLDETKWSETRDETYCVETETRR